MTFVIKQAKQWDPELGSENKNYVRLLSTNIGNRAQQLLNGTVVPDAEPWEAKRYEINDEVELDGNIYRYLINNNQITDPQEPNRITTLDELRTRVSRRVVERTVSVTGSQTTSRDFLFLNYTITNDSVTGAEPRGFGYASFLVTITGSSGFIFTGEYNNEPNFTNGLQSGGATQVSGGNSNIQVWRFEGTYDFSGSKNISTVNLNSFTRGVTITATITGDITYEATDTTPNLNRIFELQNPDVSKITYEISDSFISPIQFWGLHRSVNDRAFLDGRPSVSTGRRGGLVSVYETDTQWDSIALIRSKAASVAVFPTEKTTAENIQTAEIEAVSDSQVQIALTTRNNTIADAMTARDNAIALASSILSAARTSADARRTASLNALPSLQSQYDQAQEDYETAIALAESNFQTAIANLGTLSVQQFDDQLDSLEANNGSSQDIDNFIRTSTFMESAALSYSPRDASVTNLINILQTSSDSFVPYIINGVQYRNITITEGIVSSGASDTTPTFQFWARRVSNGALTRVFTMHRTTLRAITALALNSQIDSRNRFLREARDTAIQAALTTLQGSTSVIQRADREARDRIQGIRNLEYMQAQTNFDLTTGSTQTTYTNAINTANEIYNAILASSAGGSVEGAINTANASSAVIRIIPDSTDVTDVLIGGINWYVPAQDGKYYIFVILDEDETTSIVTENDLALGREVVSIGQVVFGNRVQIGENFATKSWNKEKVDFSGKNVDEFGNLTFTPRGSTYNMKSLTKFPVLESKNRERLFDDLLRQPAVFYRSPDIRKGTLLYGYLDKVSYRSTRAKPQLERVAELDIFGLV